MDADQTYIQFLTNRAQNLVVAAQSLRPDSQRSPADDSYHGSGMANADALIHFLKLLAESGVAAMPGPTMGEYQQNYVGRAHMAIVLTARQLCYTVTEASQPIMHGKIIGHLDKMIEQAAEAGTTVTQVGDDRMETRTFKLEDALRDLRAAMKGTYDPTVGTLPFGARPPVRARLEAYTG